MINTRCIQLEYCSIHVQIQEDTTRLVLFQMKYVHINPVFTRRKILSYWLFYLYSVFVGVCNTHANILNEISGMRGMFSGSVFCSQLGSLYKWCCVSLLEVRPLTVAQSVLDVSCNNFCINHYIFMTFHMNNSLADDIHFFMLQMWNFINT